jgi:N-methylhydantoinase A
LRIGVDIGGTFTDVVLFDSAADHLAFTKVPTTPADRAAGFFHGVDKILAEAGSSPAEVAEIAHGSTVATNAVLEGRGSRVGLLTTQGFREMLEIGRAYIPGIFTNYFRWEKPQRLVPLEDVREVPERLAADGSVVRPLDEAVARTAIAELRDAGIESLAISLIHGYANPAHEQRLETLARELAPGISVSRSSEVLPEYREYERTMTTVLNAYVMPAMARYLGEIRDGLSERGFPAELTVVRSDGGVMSLTAALERPVNTVLSGPAGGVKGATVVAHAAGFPQVISLDMGGTSTDVALSSAGEPVLSTDTWIAAYPIKVPIADITTIGAGGGSIAFLASSGALRVGPRSAGADPGPASYGRGGDRPTVTDANLVLSRLPDSLAGGEIVLDVAAAREAVRRHVAEPLGLSIEAAALGILRVVDEHMLGALRVVSVQRGVDPRDLALVPFGGAGPVHGTELARLAGIGTVLVPATPGVLSALGFLLADVRQVFTLTRVGMIDKLDIEVYNGELGRLIALAGDWLAREGVSPDDRVIEVALDLRYHGQAYELSIPIAAPLDAAGLREATARFHTEHKRRYGYDQPFARAEVVTLRVTGVGSLPKPPLRGAAEQGPDAAGAVVEQRPVFFAGKWIPTSIYDRSRLRSGNRFVGPAIVVQPDCTTVLHPGQTARVDALANLIITTAP